MRKRRLTSASSVSVRLEDTVRSFSASGRVLFYFFAGLLVVSTIALLYLLNASFLVAVPSRGGTWSEGEVGAPRFINPVLAVSDADQDLSSLVYSGLLKATPQGGYEPDLAESYTLSPDGKTYTFTLRKGVIFQDGSPVTADDVVFTIGKVQDPALKSPESANWSGANVQRIDDRTVAVTLRQPYAPFIENFTLGILPRHLWQGVSDDDFSFSPLNVSPVGSGPFRVRSVSKTSAGIPSDYTFTAFPGYALGEPYLTTMTFRLYQNEDDLIDGLKKGAVQAASGISPARLSELQGLRVEHAPLNRVFGVFFNENQSSVLRDAGVRTALNDAIDRDALVKAVLGGYGTPLSGPLPPSVLSSMATFSASSTDDLLQKAKDELAQDGWKPGATGILQKTTGSGKSAQTVMLSFTLSTGNVPELRAAAEYLRKTWSAMGVDVQVSVYDQGDLTQNVIRARKYDALLFGEVVGRVPDLYAFWDSSERLDPGLNIALYANSSADAMLQTLRTTQDEGARQTLYQQFTAAIAQDHPAVFLYAPDFVYIVPNDIQGLDLGYIEAPSDRFLSVTHWHTETENVWPVFAH
jgi:peptide/nickel transport system substrate-binding protein